MKIKIKIDNIYPDGTVTEVKETEVAPLQHECPHCGKNTMHVWGFSSGEPGTQWRCDDDECSATLLELSDEEDTLNTWAYDELFQLTGTGRTEGDAGYFVKVLECPEVPDLVGREFEWGI